MAEAGIKVDTFIPFGAPVREHQFNQGVRPGQHINVYNIGDTIQTLGGQWTDVLRGQPAGRRFDGAINVRINPHYRAPADASAWEAIQAGINNHGFMHSNVDVWRRHVEQRIIR